MQTCYFGYFGHESRCPPKLIGSTCRKVCCLSAGKKSTSYLPSFCDTAKILQNCYFGYVGYVWLSSIKTLTSACRKLWCLSFFIPSLFLEILQDIADLIFWVLSACTATPIKNNNINLKETLLFIYKQKTKLISHFFLEILQLNNLAIWLLIWSITWESEFLQVRGLQRNINNNMIFHFRLFRGKTNKKIFKKTQNIPFLAHFGPISPFLGQIRIFFKILFLTIFFNSYTELNFKINWWISSNTGFWRTHGHRDEQVWIYRTLPAKAPKLVLV